MRQMAMSQKSRPIPAPVRPKLPRATGSGIFEKRIYAEMGKINIPIRNDKPRIVRILSEYNFEKK